MYWFDSHIHLSSYTPLDRDHLIKKSFLQNIRGHLMAGYDSTDWSKQLSISNPSVYRSFGLHPWQVLEMSQYQIDQQLHHLSQLLPSAHLLGETGLDGFRAKTPEQKSLLEDVFLRHLELNRLHNRPLVLHIVKDHTRALELLKPFGYRGLVHGFSGSWDSAQEYIDRGFLISVGRGVYQKGYKNLKETVLRLPLEALLLESDAVGDADEGPEDAVDIYFRVVKSVCEIKNISQEQLQEVTFRNINRLLSKET